MNVQTWFLSMYFSTHTLYVFLIIISIGWNAYNTHQYRLLAERQLKLENILAELLPSSSSIPSFQHESTKIEQWFDKLSYFLQKFTSKDTIKKSIAKPSTVRIRFLSFPNTFYF